MSYIPRLLLMGTYESPLFRASDIGQVLDIINIRTTIHHFDDTEKVVHTMNTLGGSQSVTFLTEKGHYYYRYTGSKIQMV